MKWGFGWDVGPFEMWDMLGVQKSTNRMRAVGKKIPEWVTEMLNLGRQSLLLIPLEFHYQI